MSADADGEEIGYVDLEQMLLSESDEELLALIQREAASAAGGPLHRRVFAIRNGRIVTTEESADASRFPPKYILVHPASSSSSPLKRRSVYCRTFGERSQAFGFASCSTVPSTSVAKVAPSVPTEDEDIEMNEEPEAVSTPLPSAGSPFAVAWNSAESVDPVVIKQEVVETQLSQTVDAPVTPIRPTPIARPVPVGNEEMLRTPLRRSMSSPVAAGWASPPVSANSFVSLDRMLTPSQADTESLALEPTQYRSMSPADEFEKVSALHSKGSLGRVDRLEWKISSRREINEDGRQSPGEAALPPRYFKGEFAGACIVLALVELCTHCACDAVQRSVGCTGEAPCPLVDL